jgi:hypothetical protein
MVDFMRADLESGMGYNKLIESARKRLKEQGKDFDEEFDKWKREILKCGGCGNVWKRDKNSTGYCENCGSADVKVVARLSKDS